MWTAWGERVQGGKYYTVVALVCNCGGMEMLPQEGRKHGVVWRSVQPVGEALGYSWA